MHGREVIQGRSTGRAPLQAPKPRLPPGRPIDIDRPNPQPPRRQPGRQQVGNKVGIVHANIGQAVELDSQPAVDGGVSNSRTQRRHHTPGGHTRQQAGVGPCVQQTADATRAHGHLVEIVGDHHEVAIEPSRGGRSTEQFCEGDCIVRHFAGADELNVRQSRCPPPQFGTRGHDEQRPVCRTCGDGELTEQRPDRGEGVNAGERDARTGAQIDRDRDTIEHDRRPTLVGCDPERPGAQHGDERIPMGGPSLPQRGGSVVDGIHRTHQTGMCCPAIVGELQPPSIQLVGSIDFPGGEATRPAATATAATQRRHGPGADRDRSTHRAHEGEHRLVQRHCHGHADHEGHQRGHHPCMACGIVVIALRVVSVEAVVGVGPAPAEQWLVGTPSRSSNDHPTGGHRSARRRHRGRLRGHDRFEPEHGGADREGDRALGHHRAPACQLTPAGRAAGIEREVELEVERFEPGVITADRRERGASDHVASGRQSYGATGIGPARPRQPPADDRPVGLPASSIRCDVRATCGICGICGICGMVDGWDEQRGHATQRCSHGARSEPT